MNHNDKSPFSDLPSYKNDNELSKDFLDTWALPYYLKIGETDAHWASNLIQIKDKITEDVVLRLLGDFNWRTRQTGAFFASIKNFTDLTDIIGTHLLKSEVCYAGRVYAYTLAFFNTDKSIDYLDRYLTYYLSKKDLWFDQQAAMEALTYLDKMNQTDLASKHTENWIQFISDKPNLERHITTVKIEAQLVLIENVTKKP